MQSREDAPIKLTFETEDPDAETARLQALGVPAIRRPWGACDLVDPEGNVFALSRARSPLRA